jgi:hypothetical protein
MSSNSWCSFVPRVGKVLQQLNLAVKVNQESLVRRFACLGVGLGIGFRVDRQHQVHKLPRRLALAFHRSGYAAARIHQQSHPERQVAFPREALNGLRPPILGQRKVAHIQAGHQRAFFVAHRYRQQHLPRLHLQGCYRLVWG